MNLEPELPVLFEGENMNQYLQSVKESALKIHIDIATPNGRKELASFAYKFAKCKTRIDEHGKELVAPLKAQIKELDAIRKNCVDTLTEIQASVRAPLTQWEDAEKARQAALENNTRQMQTMLIHITVLKTQDEIQAAIESLKILASEPHDADILERTYGALKIVQAARAQIDADQAELKELREAQAAAIKREREAIAEVQRRERDEIIRRADEAREAERKLAEELRLEAAENSRVEAEKILTDKIVELEAAVQRGGNVSTEGGYPQHVTPPLPIDAREAIHNMICDDLIALGVGFGVENLIIHSIINGKIRHVEVNYDATY